MGPRTEPCGTPEDTGMLSELMPFKLYMYIVFCYPKNP